MAVPSFGVVRFILVTALLALASTGHARPAGEPKRIRIHRTELIIDASGSRREDLGKIRTEGRGALGFHFRIKLERGLKRCKEGDPRGNVSRAAVLLGGVKVAELKRKGGCWQRAATLLPAGVEPNGKRLVIDAQGEQGGVVRFWLDAYARAAPLSPQKIKPKVALIPEEKITIGAMGKVKQNIGPFDIPGLDVNRRRYSLVIRVPAAYGEDCDASKPLRPHTVSRIKVTVNRKPQGITVPESECGFTFSGGLNPRLKPKGNVVTVEAGGKPGAWFGVAIISQLK